MIKHDEMTPTNINTPTPPADETATPIVVSRPQQSISVATAVQPTKTAEISTAPPTQEVAAPRVTGGNLTMKESTGQAAVALPMQQAQSAPQTISPISTLKAG